MSLSFSVFWPGLIAVLYGVSSTNAQATTAFAGGTTGFVPAIWEGVAPLNVPRTTPTATPLSNRTVVVIGGGMEVDSCELFDPWTQRWQTSPSLMAQPRMRHTATLLNDGTILVAGGMGGPNAEPLITAEIYDALLDSWTPTANNMSYARYQHTATMLADGRVLLAGGDPTGSADIYDPATRLFVPIGSGTTPSFLSAERYGHAATLLLDGRVLVTGGTASLTATTGDLFYPGLVDDATGTWVTLPTPMTSALRIGHTSTLLPDGTVLVVGGSAGGYAVVSSCERFLPDTNEWLPAASLRTGRFGHTIVELVNGTLLVAGGEDSSGNFVTHAELYRIYFDRWDVTAPLSQGRTSHASLLMPNGQVLAIGGSRGVALNSVETYRLFGPTTSTGTTSTGSTGSSGTSGSTGSSGSTGTTSSSTGTTSTGTSSTGSTGTTSSGTTSSGTTSTGTTGTTGITSTGSTGATFSATTGVVRIYPFATLVAPSEVPDCPDAQLVLDASASSSLIENPAIRIGWDVKPLTLALKTVLYATIQPKISVPVGLLDVGVVYNFSVTVFNIHGWRSLAWRAVTKMPSSDVPTVAISGTAGTVLRKQPVTLTGLITLSPCVDNSTVTHRWRILNATGGAISSATSFVATNYQDLHLPSFFFPTTGSFTAVLRVTVWGNQTVFAEARYPIVVAPANPVALIAGSSRQVSGTVVNVVNATPSYDPDLPDAQLLFSWTCSSFGSYSLTCPSAFNTQQHQPVLTFAPNVFESGMYLFTVTVTSGASGLSSAATATLTVVYNTAVLPVYINPLPSAKVDYTDRLVLSGYADHPSASYLWSLTNGRSLGNDWSATALTSTTLVVKPNVFVAGEAYTFRLTATVPGGLSGYAEIVVRVGAVPINGWLLASPTSGAGYLSAFRLTAAGWTTKDGVGLPLQYRFSYTLPGLRPVFLGLSQFSTILDVRLPSLPASGVVSVRVTDALGVSTSRSIWVNASAPSLLDLAPFVQQQRATIENNVAGGHVDLVSVNVALLAQALNDLGDVVTAQQLTSFQNEMLDALLTSQSIAAATVEGSEMQAQATAQVLAAGGAEPLVQLKALGFTSSLLSGLLSSSEGGSDIYLTADLTDGVVSTLDQAIRALSDATVSDADARLVAISVYEAAATLSALQRNSLACGELPTTITAETWQLSSQLATSGGVTQRVTFDAASVDFVGGSVPMPCAGIQVMMFNADIASGGDPTSRKKRAQTVTLGHSLSKVLTVNIANETSLSSGVRLGFPIAFSASEISGSYRLVCQNRPDPSLGWRRNDGCAFEGVEDDGVAYCKCTALGDYSIVALAPFSNAANRQPDSASPAYIASIVVPVIVGTAIITVIVVMAVYWHRRKRWKKIERYYSEKADSEYAQARKAVDLFDKGLVVPLVSSTSSGNNPTGTGAASTPGGISALGGVSTVGGRGMDRRKSSRRQRSRSPMPGRLDASTIEVMLGEDAWERAERSLTESMTRSRSSSSSSSSSTADGRAADGSSTSNASAASSPAAGSSKQEPQLPAELDELDQLVSASRDTVRRMSSADLDIPGSLYVPRQPGLRDSSSSVGSAGATEIGLRSKSTPGVLLSSSATLAVPRVGSRPSTPPPTSTAAAAKPAARLDASPNKSGGQDADDLDDLDKILKQTHENVRRLSVAALEIPLPGSRRGSVSGAPPALPSAPASGVSAAVGANDESESFRRPSSQLLVARAGEESDSDSDTDTDSDSALEDRPTSFRIAAAAAPTSVGGRRAQPAQGSSSSSSSSSSDSDGSDSDSSASSSSAAAPVPNRQLRASGVFE